MSSSRLMILFFAVWALIPTHALCNDSRESDSQVWEVGERRWTIQEEHTYGKWVEKNITADFFIRHGIPVDCADVPYAARWIYARIAHLPVAATTGDNRLIGHWSENWRHLPTDEKWERDRRFRAALLYMISCTSTRTMPTDTYPVRIAADSVTPGTAFLIPGDHTVIVSHLVMDGSTAHPVQTLEANMPPRIQKLLLRDFTMNSPGSNRTSGLRNFRWVIRKDNRWQYLPVEEHPFYSEEQFAPAFTDGCADYLEAVARRIDPKIYDPGEKAEKIIGTLARLLNERIPVVLDGNRKCQGTHCPRGSRPCEMFNTGDRDGHISFMIYHLEKIIKKNQLDRAAILDEMARVPLRIDDNRVITLRYAFENFRWMSSEPGATIEARWGLDKCGIIAGHLKGAQESIAFIKKRYGKSDPDYARHAILVQQMIVDEMSEEAEKNDCMIDTRHYSGVETKESPGFPVR